MALQLGLRSSPMLSFAARATGRNTTMQSSFGGGASQQAMRWKSSDMGDVIGIDLGTTNSCVAIMVSCLMCRRQAADVGLQSLPFFAHKICTTRYLTSLYLSLPLNYTHTNNNRKDVMHVLLKTRKEHEQHHQ